MSEQEEREQYRQGMGDWHNFSLPLEKLFSAAEKWKQQVQGKEKLWLCWNVDPSWCLVQQKIIVSFGWTPLVGGDPRSGKPEILPESIWINFNEDFNFPKMMFHFPLELFFLWGQKIAFWHSDLLVRPEKLTKIIKRFEDLEDGATIAVPDYGGLRNYFKFNRHRYWELIGCTTKAASQSQYDCGAGWWKNFYEHPNFSSDRSLARKKHYYDHGSGIMYWKKKCNGQVYDIDQRPLKEGHCSFTVKTKYDRVSPRDQRRDLTKELSLNFNLEKVCRELELEEFL